MEWDNTSLGSNLRPFLAARPKNPLAFLFSSNNFDQQNPPLPGSEVRHGVGFEDSHTLMIQSTEKNNRSLINNSEDDFHIHDCGNNIRDKKKRLTCDQLESLERSFLEEIKLDQDRKMRLARDLGLQPRQIAVWFQNRRARWKNKELERLYDALKQEYDVVSREKQKLQEEVGKLQAMLREHHGMKNKVSTTGYNEVSGEESMESAAAVVNRPQPPPSQTESHHIIKETNYFQNKEDYIPLPVRPSYWHGSSHQLPPYP